MGRTTLKKRLIALTPETSTEAAALIGHVDTGKDSMEVGKTSAMTNKPPKEIIAAGNTTRDSASTEKEVIYKLPWRVWKRRKKVRMSGQFLTRLTKP